VFQAKLPMGADPGPEFRYGDSFWTLPPRKAYMAVGFHGQRIMVLPEHGIVAVTTSRANYRFDLFFNGIDAAVRWAAPLPADAAASDALAAALRAIATEPAGAASAPPPANAEQLAGRTWKAARNRVGVKEFRLHLDAQPRIELVEWTSRDPNSQGTRTTMVPLRTDGGSARMETPRGPMLIRARWLPDGALAVQNRFVEEGESANYVMRFEGRRVNVEFAHTMGFTAKFTAEAAD
jgi:hypothetical protein